MSGIHTKKYEIVSRIKMLNNACLQIKQLLAFPNNNTVREAYVDDVLIDHIMRGRSRLEICEIYGIPYDRLKQRLRHIAYDMYVERMNIMEIRNKTGITAQELLGEIDRREGPDKSKCIRSQRDGIHEPLY